MSIDIHDFQHLSLLLGIKKEELAKIVNGNTYFYREFVIPKRKKGQFRIISSPLPILKYCQDWIKINILDSIGVNSHAYAYKKGVSIVDNVIIHLNTTEFYKIDLENFFGSIPFRRVMKVFLNCGYSKNVSYFLSNLCTLKNQLPQGASTSPSLSNIISKRLDKRISKLSYLTKINYSRYSDDLSFSGEKIPITFQHLVKKIILEEGFTLNKKKEIYVNGINKKKIITGISISNGEELKLPRVYKRNLKLEIFKYLKYDFKISITSDNFDPLIGDRLLGKLHFWKQIEKENQLVENYIDKVRAKNESLNYDLAKLT